MLLSTLALQGYGKQASNTNSPSSRQNLAQRTVRLDPLLRRALLRALTELEKEAQEKAKEEEARNTRSEHNESNQPENNQDKQADSSKDEIQSTADTIYPTSNPSNAQETSPPVETSTNHPDAETPPATIQDAFFFQTPAPIEDDLSGGNQPETKSPDATLTPPDIESNLISDDKNNDKDAAETTESNTEKTEAENSTKKSTKAVISDNDVDIFKAPLVAAFTLHQDSRGTPHSIIPLFRNQNQDINQRKKLLEQQLALFKQQQQQFLRQNQFIPSVTITPLSQPHHFSNPPRIFSPSTITPFPSSTAFPPIVSNSILPQNFPSSVIPAQSFHVSSTVSPLRSSQRFVSTVSPQNFSPQFSSTPIQQNFQGVSIVPSHNFNFSPTPQPNFASPTPSSNQPFQPISIPPVTLPLQNEPRFQNPIVVPSIQINPGQNFRNQFFDDNRQRQFEDQNRQRQIEEQNRQRQIDEQNRQRQIEEQNRQRQIDEQNRQRQIEEQNRARQRQHEERQKKLAEQNNIDQFRQQRQEQGVDFQRSLGFTFNQNRQNFNRLPPNNFNFQIQPSQNFGGFNDVETRNRVNRQEGFANTGNFGFNRQNDQRQFNSNQNQFQGNPFSPSFPQEYRTIPEEHYRSLPQNRFNPIPQATRFQPIVQPSQFQFRPQPNQFQKTQIEIQQSVQSVNKQLENLLLQSGVATDASGQEDLNIVSKVLALNHERSDTDIDDENININRSERRAEDQGKSLLVGEIKDIEVTTPYSVHA